MSRLRWWAQAVVAQATFSKLGLSNQVVLVNGNIGLACRLPDGRLFSVIDFTIAHGKIVEMHILADQVGRRRIASPFSYGANTVTRDVSCDAGRIGHKECVRRRGVPRHRSERDDDLSFSTPSSYPSANSPLPKSRSP